MDTNFHQNDKILYNQIEEAYGKVVYTYTTQIIHAGHLKKRNDILKWAQLILSAISTGGFIGTLITNQLVLVWIGGLCSTALLVLTAYFKDSELSATYQKHMSTSNALWLIREEYLSLLTDYSMLAREEITNRRDDLARRTAKIYENAPLTDGKSFSLARSALKNNESQFFTREELNQMLPEKLRQ